MVLAVVLSATLAAPAGAATVTAEPATVEEDWDDRYLAVAVTAARGEGNRLTVAWRARRVEVSDRGASLRAGRGCVATTPQRVRCALPRRVERADVRVGAGDGSDRVRVAGAVEGMMVRIRGGAGDDVLRAGDATAVLSGGAGDDRLVGGRADDWLYGGPGRDALSGGRSADVLNAAGGGDDRLAGGPGGDLATYGRSPTGVRVTLARPARVRGSGTDRLRGIERVLGSEHADVMRGGPGDDRLFGFGGRDVIDGFAGDDVLTADGCDPNPPSVSGVEGEDCVDGARSSTVRGGPGADRLGSPGPRDDCGPGQDWIVTEDGMYDVLVAPDSCEFWKWDYGYGWIALYWVLDGDRLEFAAGPEVPIDVYDAGYETVIASGAIGGPTSSLELNDAGRAYFAARPLPARVVVDDGDGNVMTVTVLLPPP